MYAQNPNGCSKSTTAGHIYIQERIRSMELMSFTGTAIPKNKEKHPVPEPLPKARRTDGYGSGNGSRDTHEAQGTKFENVVLVRSQITTRCIHYEESHIHKRYSSVQKCREILTAA